MGGASLDTTLTLVALREATGIGEERRRGRGGPPPGPGDIVIRHQPLEES